jgi:hypothetical protein
MLETIREYALEEYLAPARATIAPGEWDAALAAGRALTQQQPATLLASASPSPDTAESSAGLPGPRAG